MFEACGNDPAGHRHDHHVSCTGFMIPSLDAHLINLMGFRSDVRRMPFTELGLRRRRHGPGPRFGLFAIARRRQRPDIAVELPSLTFHAKTFRKRI